jgi:hypothetical protein
MYETLNTVLNLYDPHTFELSINPHVITPALFVAGGFLSYQTSAMPIPYVFIIERKAQKVSSEGEGSDTMSISGRGVKAIFESRRHIEEFNTGTGYDGLTSKTFETVMRHYIDQEAIICTDSKRRLPGITYAETDFGRGGTVDSIQKRGESLLDTLTELSKVSALSYDLVWQNSGTNFEVVFYEGVDRSIPGDPDCVVLSINYHNVKGYNYVEDITALKNLIYIAGSGDGAARILEEVYSPSPSTEPEGWTRRETFIDGTDCKDSVIATERQKLAVSAQTTLTDSAESINLSFEYNPISQSYIFGRDFTLGDIVNIVFPDVATLTSRIVSVSWTYDENGVEISMEAGKTAPDFVKILKGGILRAGIGGKH